MKGDIMAYQALFSAFQQPLKSYLYRLLTDRDDVEDVAQDAFVKGFDKIATFNRRSSFKTWVFRIATNLAYDLLRRRKRWSPEAQERSKVYAQDNGEVQHTFRRVHAHAPQGAYEIREHIDFCFTCISKTLPITHQVALILKDIYGFPVRDIALILDTTEATVKNHLHAGRMTLAEIFEHRCALINKQGICHQCTELNGVFNPKQNHRAQALKIEMVREAENQSAMKLYELRARLVKSIDPLHASGAALHEEIMNCTRKAIGEI